jgi:hypothetical protein
MFSFCIVGQGLNFKLTFYSGSLGGEILVSKIYIIIFDVNKKGGVD